MNTDLRSQKFEILRRLIQEDSLNLEEVLILLAKEEPIDNQEFIESYTIPMSDAVNISNPECSTWNMSVSSFQYDEITLTV